MSEAVSTTLLSLEKFAKEQPEKTYLVDRLGGTERQYSYQEGWQVIEQITRSLATLFPDSRRNISILSNNRAHWTLADNGILRSGNVTVPLFGTMTEPVFTYALDFCDVALLFLGDAENWEAVKNALPEHVKIVGFPDIDIPELDYSFDEFLALGSETPMPAHPKPDDPCTVIFTSGTTGYPKGVVHSLTSIYQLLRDIREVIGHHDRFLSYLPLAHGGDRFLVSHHCSVTGGQITYNSSPETFVADMQAAKPTFLLGVPRIWEKLSEGVIAMSGLSAEAFSGMLEGEQGPAMAHKIRSSLGLENLEFAMTSTAPTPYATKLWWQKIGIALKEGYAQTEILPVAMARREDPLECGVGQAAPGVEIKILETGEIICRGPGMSLGYYNNEEKQAETYVNGWVHTGDKGEIDEKGYLHITGRVSEIVKTAKGKYVAPAPIENAFAASSLVGVQCLAAYGLTQPVMLCCLSENAPTDEREVEASLRGSVTEINSNLEKHEKIGAVLICRSPWTPQNGILTHTMKVKRDAVAEKYTAEISELNRQISEGERGRLLCSWCS